LGIDEIAAISNRKSRTIGSEHPLECGHSAAEFGITAAKWIAHLDPLRDRIQVGEDVPNVEIART
jgi:hypothetical protein